MDAAAAAEADTAAPTTEKPRLSTKERVAELAGQMEDAVARIGTEEGFRAWLSTASKFHRYSIGNQMLIAMQRPDATRVAGMSTWNQMGRRVMKGEQSIVILRPVIKKFDVENPDTGEKEARRRVAGFTGARVFDVAQTEGDPLPEPPPFIPINGPAPEGAIEGLTAFSEANDVPVTFTDDFSSIGMTDPGVLGVTVWKDGRGNPPEIMVRSDLSGAEQTRVLAHEIAHSLMHNTEQLDEFGQSTPEKEAEAETVALIVSDHLGIDTSESSYNYVAGWTRGDPDMVKASGDRIQKAASKIIEGLPTNESRAFTDAGERAATEAKNRPRKKRKPRKKAGAR